MTMRYVLGRPPLPGAVLPGSFATVSGYCRPFSLRAVEFDSTFHLGQCLRFGAANWDDENKALRLRTLRLIQDELAYRRPRGWGG